jgi:hypothetical protein
MSQSIAEAMAVSSARRMSLETSAKSFSKVVKSCWLTQLLHPAKMQQTSPPIRPITRNDRQSRDAGKAISDGRVVGASHVA